MYRWKKELMGFSNFQIHIIFIQCNSFVIQYSRQSWENHRRRSSPVWIQWKLSRHRTCVSAARNADSRHQRSFYWPKILLSSCKDDNDGYHRLRSHPPGPRNIDPFTLVAARESTGSPLDFKTRAEGQRSKESARHHGIQHLDVLSNVVWD